MPDPRESAALLFRNAMNAGFDPVKLASLRGARIPEMQRNLERSEGDRLFGTGATRSDLNNLMSDQNSDPYTGTVARQQVADTENALDNAALLERPEIEQATRTGAERNAFADFLKKQSGYQAEASLAGEYALDADARRKAAIVATPQTRTSIALTGDGGATQTPYQRERAVRNLDSIDALSAKVGNWTAGWGGSLLRNLPATDARNFAAELDTLKANIGFGELQAMREASKTGGALGQISDRESQLLQASLGALDMGQSPANLKAQLEKVKQSIYRWQSAVRGGLTRADAEPGFTDPNWGR